MIKDRALTTLLSRRHKKEELSLSDLAGFLCHWPKNNDKIEACGV
jgi:hypothetical protein